MPTWTGNSSVNLLSAGNWDGGAVPSIFDDVNIDNGGIANQPALFGGRNFAVNSIALSGGGLSLFGSLTVVSQVAVTGLGSIFIGKGGALIGNLNFSAPSVDVFFSNSGSILGGVTFQSNSAGAHFLNGGTVSGVVSFMQGGIYESTSAGSANIIGSSFSRDTAILDRRAWASGLNVSISDGGGARDIGDGTRLTFFDVISVQAGSAADTLTGGNQADMLSGNGGNDVLQGRGGVDVIDGGVGSDTAVYSDKTDGVQVTLAREVSVSVVVGGVVEDTILNVENIVGGSGNDVLIGDLLANRFAGGAGNDELQGGLGRDLLDGGAGFDRASYSDKSNAVLVMLNGSFWVDVLVGGVVEDRIRNIENIVGGSGDDVLIGDTRPNYLIGGLGNDLLQGGGGNDALDGGAGADALLGGAGNDTYVGDTVADLVIENSGEGNDTVRSANLSLNLASFTNIENLALLGTSVLNATGNNAANLISGNAGANTLLALGGNDTVNGGGGNDSIDGGSGNDLLDGGGANDSLIGGSGNDTLFGGTGKDQLTGGANADVFAWRSSAEAGFGVGRDVVTDFAVGVDKLDLSVIDAHSLLAGDQAFSFLGAGAFTGAAGQLRYASGILQGDTDGNGVADFQIQLIGNPTISLADFVL